MKSHLVFLFTLFSSLLLSYISINPLKLEQNLQDNTVETFSFKLKSHAGSSVKVTASLSSWVPTEDGGFSVKMNAGNVQKNFKNSCLSWINTSENSYIIPPEGQVEYPLVVKVPKDISGTYVAYVDFVVELVEKPKSGITFNLNMGAYILFHIHPNTEEIKVELSQLQLKNTPEESKNQLDILATFQNECSYASRGSALISINDIYGKTVFQERTKFFYLLPHSFRNFHYEFSPNLPDGAYSLLFTYENESDNILIGEYSFSSKGHRLET